MSERVEAGEYNYGFTVGDDGIVTAHAACAICGTGSVVLGCDEPGCKHVWRKKARDGDGAAAG